MVSEKHAPDVKWHLYSSAHTLDRMKVKLIRKPHRELLVENSFGRYMLLKSSKTEHHLYNMIMDILEDHHGYTQHPFSRSPIHTHFSNSVYGMGAELFPVFCISHW